MSRTALYWIVTLGLLAAMLALRIADPEPIARLRASVFDAYIVAQPRVADGAMPVRIVDIDEASLAKLGQWPWPRTRLAQIVERLTAAGAQVVAFDLVMPEADRMSPNALLRELQSRVPGLGQRLVVDAAQLPSNDATLGTVIAAAPVVLGFSGTAEPLSALPAARASFVTAGDDPRLFVPRYGGALASLPVIGAGARGLGAVNWQPSQDQIVRRVAMLANVNGALYPSLALEALRIAQRETTLFVRSSGGSGTEAFGQQTGVSSVRVGKTVVPVDGAGQLWLHYAAADPGRYIPAYRVLEDGFPAAEVKGRMVLIGSSSPLLFDLRATPLSASVPGVEIHAQALEQMLSGEHLSRPDFATGAELLFLAASGGLVAWLIARVGARTAAAVGVASLVLVAVASWWLYRSAGYLFDPVYPALALVAVYSAGALHNARGTERERAQIRATFSHYMAPALVDQLARDPSRLKLGGETRTVTVLFADVRGFTRLSEQMAAEDLVALLNRLFTPLTEAIVAHGGTVDKFIGDAVMAYWNAPVEEPDHAARACAAALGMTAAVVELNLQREAEARAAGIAFVPLDVGIGINTGPCCAGNLGSPRRFDYSIIGEAVNVAARLEAVTRTYGVPVIAGEATSAAAAGFAMIEIDTIVPRGRVRPERIFAVLGAPDFAATAVFGDLIARNDRVRAALAAGDQEGARAALLRFVAVDAADGPAGAKALAGMARYYEGQVAALGLRPPSVS